MEVDERCRTPTRGEYQIPAAPVCPPPPKKKPCYLKQRRSPPKEGYFHPPDLEAILLNIAPGREACA
ncbi:cyclin-dependent protein kinase inhibitor SMR [Salix suchowensis]|nr:cyclin-dependent protein kinase inhibitor SMR [Salix suchowensis]